MAARPAAPSPLRERGCCLPVARPLADDRAERLAAVFRALADPTRVQMVHILKAASEPVCVCDLTAAFDLAQPTVSHHLARLRDAGLVVSERRGIWSFHALAADLPPAIQAIVDQVP